jgi:acyl-CoA synthetase (AMP-forming)/AMP-acid ligase II
MKALVVIALHGLPVFFLFLQCRCTIVYGTPTMFVDLLAIARKTKNLNTDTLDLGVGAGALFSKELIQELLQTLKLRRFCVSRIFF